jgi:hypothetical protein
VQAVEDGGEHPHVVGGALLDDLAAGRELSAAEDIAPPTTMASWTPRCTTRGLAGDVERLVDVDAALACAEALAAELRTTRLYFGLRASAEETSSMGGALPGFGNSPGIVGGRRPLHSGRSTQPGARRLRCGCSDRRRRERRAAGRSESACCRVATLPARGDRAAGGHRQRRTLTRRPSDSPR